MEYTTVQVKAKEWNLSERRVQQYCKGGLIDGSIRVGRQYLIPKNLKNPFEEHQSLDDLIYFFPTNSYALADLFVNNPNIDFVDDDHRCIFNAEVCFYRYKIREARYWISQVSKSDNLIKRISVLRVNVKLCYAENNLEAPHLLDYEISRLRLLCRDNVLCTHLLDLVTGHAGLLISLPSTCSEYIIIGKFIDLPISLRPYACAIHSMYLLSEKKYDQMLGFIQGFYSFRSSDGKYEIIDLYSRILLAISLMRKNRFEEAKKLIRKCNKLGLHHGIYMPYAELHTSLMGLDSLVLEDEEQPYYKEMIACWDLHRESWITLHNYYCKNKIMDVLSDKELSIAGLCVSGLSNREIADVLNLSVETIKSYLQIIYQKTYVSGRKELQNMHFDI